MVELSRIEALVPRDVWPLVACSFLYGLASIWRPRPAPGMRQRRPDPGMGTTVLQPSGCQHRWIWKHDSEA